MAACLSLQPLAPCPHATATPGAAVLLRCTQSALTIFARRKHSYGRKLVPNCRTRRRTAATVEKTTTGRRDQEQGDYETLDVTKSALNRALQGIDRGIFGLTSVKKSEVEGLVELLESLNPTPDPTGQLLNKVGGCWKLIYGTISILGSKRTKLGLRGFISLGDFLQIIDVAKEKAINVIKFNARGLKILSGQLTVVASYKIATKTRVDIKLESSSITPDQLMNIFQKNYDLLLAIFNPEGWLEITYVDDSLRIGRDDKGNIFVLERAEQ